MEVQISLPNTAMMYMKEPVKRLPLGNAGDRIVNPGGAFFQVRIDSSAPQPLTYNKWGGIVTWTKHFNDFIDFHVILD